MKKKLFIFFLLSTHLTHTMNQNPLRELKRSVSSKTKSADKTKPAEESPLKHSAGKKHSRSCETLPKQTQSKKLQRSMSVNDSDNTPTTRSFSEKHSSKKSSPIYTRIKRSPATKKHTSPLTDIAEERKEKDYKNSQDFSSYIPINDDTINQKYSHQETILIWAARNNQLLSIKKVLSFQNAPVNAQKDDGNTAFHLAAQSKDIKSIELLLHDHRTDTSIINNESKTARDMIVGNSDECTELRRKIFAKIMLDTIINTTCDDSYTEHILTNNDTSKEELEKTIIQIMDSIKTEFNKDQNRQSNDRELPSSAQFPLFADDEFIKKAIAYRLQNKKQIALQ